MSRLREQIPANFYSIFKSDLLGLYMDYMIAIYKEVSTNGLYAIKGLSKAECRDAVVDIPISNYIDMDTDDIQTGPFTNKYLNRLLTWGWLNSRYDETAGEDLITIPEYSKLFVRVFRELDDDIAKSSYSIRDVYANIVAYQHSGQKDIDFLSTALRNSQELNVTLSSSSERMEDKISDLMSYNNAPDLITSLLAALTQDQNESYSEMSDRGRFRTYHGSLVRELDALMNKALNEIETAEESRDSAAAQDERQEWDALIAELYAPYNLLKGIRKETDKALQLFHAVITHSSEMCVRALQRLKYINAAGTKEEASRLMQTIRLLSEEHSHGKHTLVDKAGRIFAYNWEPDIFLDHDVYTKRDLIAAEGKIYIPNLNEGTADNQQFKDKPKYSGAELKSFEKKHVKNGRFTVENGSITTPEDIDILLHLYLDITNDPLKQYTIQAGEDVPVIDGLSYPTLSWEETQ